MLHKITLEKLNQKVGGISVMLQNQPPALSQLDEKVLASKLPPGYLEREWKDRQESLFLLYVVLKKLMDSTHRALLHPDLQRWLSGDSVDKSVLRPRGGVWEHESSGRLNKEECLSWAKAQYHLAYDRRPFQLSTTFSELTASKFMYEAVCCHVEILRDGTAERAYFRKPDMFVRHEHNKVVKEFMQDSVYQAPRHNQNAKIDYLANQVRARKHTTAETKPLFSSLVSACSAFRCLRLTHLRLTSASWIIIRPGPSSRW
jgi:hypothetical protein